MVSHNCYYGMGISTSNRLFNDVSAPSTYRLFIYRQFEMRKPIYGTTLSYDDAITAEWKTILPDNENIIINVRII